MELGPNWASTTLPSCSRGGMAGGGNVCAKPGADISRHALRLRTEASRQHSGPSRQAQQAQHTQRRYCVPAARAALPGPPHRSLDGCCARAAEHQERLLAVVPAGRERRAARLSSFLLGGRINNECAGQGRMPVQRRGNPGRPGAPCKGPSVDQTMQSRRGTCRPERGAPVDGRATAGRKGLQPQLQALHAVLLEPRQGDVGEPGNGMLACGGRTKGPQGLLVGMAQGWGVGWGWGARKAQPWAGGD